MRPGDQAGGGQRKETHYHYGNGSSKIVWAWAGVSTLIVISFLGLMVRAQWSTNESLRATNTAMQNSVNQLTVRLTRLEEQIATLQRTIERLE